jgi:hypothetical protein
MDIEPTPLPSDDASIETPEKPARGSPQSAAWFRQALEDLGETQASLARLMKRKGDDRQPDTILRTIKRMATGDARVSGEMRVLLTMMQRARARGERRTTEKAAKRAERSAEESLTASTPRT